jgi:hypothetical protein
MTTTAQPEKSLLDKIADLFFFEDTRPQPAGQPEGQSILEEILGDWQGWTFFDDQGCASG